LRTYLDLNTEKVIEP